MSCNMEKYIKLESLGTAFWTFSPVWSCENIPLLNAAESWSCWDVFGHQAELNGVISSQIDIFMQQTKAVQISLSTDDINPSELSHSTGSREVKCTDYSKFPENTVEKTSCSSQILFVFRVKGLYMVPVLVLSRRVGVLYSLSTCVINIWSVTFWFWGILPKGMLEKNILIVSRVLLRIFGSSRRCFSKKHTLHRR